MSRTSGSCNSYRSAVESETVNPQPLLDDLSGSSLYPDHFWSNRQETQRRLTLPRALPAVSPQR
jgi:hypothetical protein